MARKLHFKGQITIQPESSFESFVGQFQTEISDVLTVINGTTLRLYKREGPFPSNLRFENKHRKIPFTEYYFRDIDNDTTYCVFGFSNALLFYPRLLEFEVPSALKEPSIVKEHVLLKESTHKSTTEIKETKENKKIIIIDKGQKLEFPLFNFSVEIVEHELT